MEPSSFFLDVPKVGTRSGRRVGTEEVLYLYYIFLS